MRSTTWGHGQVRVPFLLFDAGAFDGPSRVKCIGVSAHKVYHVTHLSGFGVGDAGVVDCRPFEKRAVIVIALRAELPRQAAQVQR